MAYLVSLKDTIKSRDLYKALKNTLKWLDLSTVNISGIVIDGALVMVAKRKGLVNVTEDIEIAAQNCMLSMSDEVSLHSTSRQLMHKSFKNG